MECGITIFVAALCAITSIDARLCGAATQFPLPKGGYAYWQQASRSRRAVSSMTHPAPQHLHSLPASSGRCSFSPMPSNMKARPRAWIRCASRAGRRRSGRARAYGREQRLTRQNRRDFREGGVDSKHAPRRPMIRTATSSEALRSAIFPVLAKREPQNTWGPPPVRATEHFERRCCLQNFWY